MNQTITCQVTPAENLMRGHGIVGDIVQIYEAVLYRLHTNTGMPDGVLYTTADIARTYLNKYHERLEDQFLFPRFRERGVLADLAQTLFAQHIAGRKLTISILRISETDFTHDDAAKTQLERDIRLYEKMYGPHAARENTVFFPAMHEVFSCDEYERMAGAFLEMEDKLFGPNGFEHVVNKVTKIQKSLGLFELDKFTPKI
jgi:hemerythrin-like domain-containing protein